MQMQTKIEVKSLSKVVVKCISKKEALNWDAKNPKSYAIELEVPYDQNSVYRKLSGGTNLILNTVNHFAADMFQIGESYDIDIYPSPKPEVQPTAEAIGAE